MPGPLPTQRPGLRLIEPQGGGTSSRPDDKNVVAGVDTLRLRWREDREVYERWRRRPQGCYEGARGELWDRLPGTGARVGVLPDGLVYVEGRVAALLHGEDDHSLVPAGRLPLAARVTAERLARTVARVAGELERRFTFTTDVYEAFSYGVKQRGKNYEPMGELVWDETHNDLGNRTWRGG